MENLILDTTKFVVEESKDVTINREVIKKIALRWKKENWRPPEWDFSYHFFDRSARTLTYFFILDSVNFSFWTLKKEQKYRRHYQGKEIDGYNALALSLKFAFLRKHPIERTDNLLSVKRGEFLSLLDGKGKLPLLEKRLHVLHQNALVLKKKFQREFANVLKEAGGDGVKLALLLVKNFPSFNDTAQFEGKTILFHKRAQLLANDISTIFRGRGLGELKNMDKLTAFADYKLPQILRHWKILEYGEELAKTIDAKKELKKRSRQEVEIRANTIWAVEYVKEDLAKEGIALQSREIDWFLWKRAREEKGMKPYHRVRTIFY